MAVTIGTISPVTILADSGDSFESGNTEDLFSDSSQDNTYEDTGDFSDGEEPVLNAENENEGDFEDISADTEQNPDFVISDGVLTEYTGSDEEVVIPDQVKEIGSKAFENNTLIKKVTIPEGVAKIGDYAFSGCTALESAPLPQSLEGIGEYSFQNCGALKSSEGGLSFGDNLTKIGKYAFYGCKSLSGNLVIPDSVTEIGEYAFYNCTGFGGILKLSANLKTIPDYAFQSCGFTGNLILPENLEKIGRYAFYGNSFTGELVIPDHVSQMNYSAFGYCRSLEKLVIGTGISSIPYNGFYKCDGLKEIEISGSVTNIVAEAFAYCEGAKELRFKGETPPEIKLNSSGQDYFFGTYGMKNLEKIHVPAGCYKTYAETYGSRLSSGARILEEGAEDYLIENGVLTAYTGNAEEVSVPEGVTEIGTGAFQNNKELKKVTLPEGITKIGNYAFAGCAALENMPLPASLKEIGEYSFQNCSALKSSEGGLSFGDNLTKIGKYAFYGCKSLSGNLVIPDSVTEIGEYAFYNCTGFGGILKLSANLKTIPDYAFQSCGFTGNLILPENLEKIGRYAFYGNSFTGELVIPDHVSQMNYSAFGYCRSLEKLVIGTGISSIPYNGFYKCDGLKEIEISGSVTNIVAEAFAYCEGAKELRFKGKTPPEIKLNSSGQDYFFGTYGMKNLEKIYVPAGCYKVYAEAYGSRLNNGTRILEEGAEDYLIENGVLTAYTGTAEEVNVPENVTEIGTGAFQNNKELKKVTLPEGITKIGNYAFSGCTALENVSLPESLKEIGEYSFRNCSALKDSKGSLVFGNNLIKIGKYAFYGCKSLSGDMVIPDSVTEIGEYAFYNCTGFNGTLKLSATLKTIPDYAFQSCGFTGTLILPEKLEKIGRYAFYGNNFNSELVIPDHVSQINSDAFAYCKNIEKLVIGSGISNIPYECFYRCEGLDEILFSDNVTTIGDRAFGFCANVKTLTFLGNTPPELKGTPKTMFFGYQGMKKLETIYVPSDALEQYKEKWSSLTGENVAFSGDSMALKVTGLQSVYTISHSAKISWNPSLVKDIEGYHIYRDGNLVGETEELSFEESDLDTGIYLYEVAGYRTVQEEKQETARASLEVTLRIPEIKEIYTGFEGNKLNEENDWLYASVSNFKNLQKGEKSAVGRFYLLQNGQQKKIESDISEPWTLTGENGIYRVEWDVRDLDEGSYEIQFVLTDADGESVKAVSEVSIDRSSPEKISSISAIGDTGCVVLSWSMAHELETNRYNIYRRKEGTAEFTQIKKIYGRNIRTYTDTKAEEGVLSEYYVTAVNPMGKESEPSESAFAMPEKDREAPRVIQMNPVDGSLTGGKVWVTIQAEDNVGVIKTELQVSEDKGETWTSAGTDSGEKGKILLDTGKYADGKILVRGLAYDAENNVSTGLQYTYRVDNTGPEQVQGLRYESGITTATIYWNDVKDEDLAFFRVEKKEKDGTFAKVKDVYHTLGINLNGLTTDTDYIYRVVAYDQCGNRGTASEELTVTTQKDTAPPQILSIKPEAGYYNREIPLEIQAKDDTGVDSIRIQISRDESIWNDLATVTFEKKGKTETASYNLQLDDYEEGSIYIRALGKDTLKNETTIDETTGTVEYVIDRTEPDIPTGFQITEENGKIQLKWDAASQGDVNGYFIYRSFDGENYEEVASDYTYLNYWDSPDPENEEVWYQLAAKDLAGNVSGRTDAVRAKITADRTPPVLESSVLQDGDILGTGNKIFRILVSDNYKLDKVKVYYRVNDSDSKQLLLEEEKLNCPDKLIGKTLPVEKCNNGDQIHFSVMITDTAGNETSEGEFTCIVDKVPPQLSDVKAMAKEDRIIVSWKGEKEGKYTVYRKTGASYVFVDETENSGEETYTYEDTQAENGITYVYKIEAEDIAGNKASIESKEIWLPNKSRVTADLECESYMEKNTEYLFDASGSSADEEIQSYTFDFGDGISKTITQAVMKHRYAEKGNYTATVTVTDISGKTSSVSRNICVDDPMLIGQLKVRLKDSTGNPLSGMAVYFDMDKSVDNKKYTDADGYAIFQATAGTYYVGSYGEGYLPVKKGAVIRAGETTVSEITMTAQPLVTGKFEINRMTLEEIKAAGIDTKDPANQYVSKFTVKMSYWDEPVYMTGYMNGNEIVKGVKKRVWSKTGEQRELRLISVPYSNEDTSGSHSKSHIVAIIDVPVCASILKEFFEVRLYILNQADGEFTLADNRVELNVPDGLTLMSCDNGSFRTLKGQEQKNVTWVLRGDKKGDYNLNAEYRGTLLPFNENISASFETEEPLHVYGPENVKIRFKSNATIKGNALYFNVSMENNSPMDIHITGFDVIDNILRSYQNVGDVQDGKKDDFLNTEREVKILKTSLSGNGRISYTSPDTEVTTLKAGQTFTKYYVCYSSIYYDATAYLGWMVKVCQEQMDMEVILEKMEADLYDSSDSEQKREDILRLNKDKQELYQFIKDSNNENFYYYIQALKDDGDKLKQFGEATYRSTDCVLNLDFSLLNNNDMKEITRKYVARMLSDESFQKGVNKKIEKKYLDITKNMISTMSGTIKEEDPSAAEELSGFASNATTVKALATALQEGGNDTFQARMLTLMKSSVSAGTIYLVQNMIEDNLATEILGEAVKTSCKEVAGDILGPVSQGIDAWNSSAEFINDMVTICANQEEAEACIDCLMTADYINEACYAELSEIKESIRKGYASRSQKFAKDFAEIFAKSEGKAVIDKTLGLIDQTYFGGGNIVPTISIMKTAFNIGDDLFEWDDKVDSLQKLRIAASLTYSLKDCLVKNGAADGDPDQFMKALKYLIKMRLEGERAYIDIVKKEGKESEVLDLINREKGTTYASLGEYYAHLEEVMYSYRDILFGESYSVVQAKEAPQVSINYETESTNEKIGQNLEYSFDGIAWKRGNGDCIKLIPKEASAHLWVREHTEESELAGNIKKLLIPTRPTIAGEISAVYEDGVLTVTGLPEGTYKVTKGASGTLHSDGKTATMQTDSYSKTISFVKNATERSFSSVARIVSVKEVHKHKWEVKRTEKATCITKGKIYYICTGCTETKEEVIPLTDHSYTWKVSRKPTALKTGLKVQKCTVCDKTGQTAAIAKLKATGKLSAATVTLYEKQSKTVKVTGMATGDYVRVWVSGNKKIATVTSKGLIKGIKNGNTTVTAILASGKRLSVKVQIKKKIIKTTSLTVKPTSIVLKKGKKVSLKVAVKPDNSGEKVTYKSLNTKVATVNSKGVVYGKAKGTTSIRVQSGSKVRTVKVTVK